MSDSQRPATGSIAWTDLTVPDAGAVSDFYSAVVGWRKDAVSMGDYDDFTMLPAADDDAGAVAGICHARGGNAGLPAQWMIYIVVDDVDASARRCTELGGKVLIGPKGAGGTARSCVIEDPAGAVATLYQPG